MNSSRYSGIGSISGNQFSGEFTTTDDPYFFDGDFAGGFFGPAAQEMGYGFMVKRGLGSPDDPLVYVVGAVVGTKNGN